MSYETQIYSQAAELLGNVPTQAQDRLELACAAAEAGLTGQLREGVQPGDLGSSFLSACAVLAVAYYLEMDGAFSPQSFRIGDVSVSGGSGSSGGKGCAELRALARSMLTGYLRDEGFAFLGVRG